MNIGTTTRYRYNLDVRAVNNYYPFGMLMLDMSWQTSGYRYGFGSHENDNDVKGEGNHSSFGDYGYDPRVGRRMMIEPLNHYYPSYSNYCVVGNNPILLTDSDGRKWRIYPTPNAEENVVKLINYIFDGKVKINIDDKGFVELEKLEELNEIQNLSLKYLQDIISSNYTVLHQIEYNNKLTFFGSYHYVIDGPGIIDYGDFENASQFDDSKEVLTAIFIHEVMEQFIRKSKYPDDKKEIIQYKGSNLERHLSPYEASHNQAIPVETLLLGYKKRNEDFSKAKYKTFNGEKYFTDGPITFTYEKGNKFLTKHMPGLAKFFNVEYHKMVVEFQLENAKIVGFKIIEINKPEDSKSKFNNPLGE